MYIKMNYKQSSTLKILISKAQWFIQMRSN